MTAPVDWAMVLTQCKGAGQKWKAVEHGINLNYASRGQYMKGVTPRYDTGERIIAYWSAKTGRPISEVPRVAV